MVWGGCFTECHTGLLVDIGVHGKNLSWLFPVVLSFSKGKGAEDPPEYPTQVPFIPPNMARDPI
jgi:hypothetical protein